LPESVTPKETGTAVPTLQRSCTTRCDTEPESREDVFRAIFGAHVADASQDSDFAWRASVGQCGIVRYWQVEHGELRVVSRGNRASSASARESLFRTGSFLLLVVDNGSVDVELYNGVRCLSAGDALLFTAIEPLTVTTRGRFAATWVNLPIWWLIDLFGSGVTGARVRLAADSASTEALRAVLSKLRDPARRDLPEDLVDLFGDVLLRCLTIAGRSEPVSEGPFDRISRFVGTHYLQEGLSPGDAAAALGCSISSIHKYCAAAGTSFGKLLMMMRLSHAAYRLARNDARVSQIAFDCGFTSVSHFCNAFRAVYGVTPKNARRRHTP
jgi:AraC-like DNA-binding protein